MKRVFVGLSGGVDSSVAAYLLQKQGYAVTGVFIRCWSGGSPSHSLGITHSSSLGVSCADEDAEYARRVAEHLKIPFYVFDLEEEYKKRVIEYMINGYKKGATPNPDVMCNKEIKFDLFLREALAMGANFIATGHYVRLRRKFQIPSASWRNKSQTNSKLFTAKDKNKDQSYFLWTLTQDQLQHCLFPIGKYLKSEVREIARKAKLPTAEKKDSQGICFLGKITLHEFLKQYIPPKKGETRDEKGNAMGTHDGAWYYTIGQRHGLDLKYAKTPKSKPRYVVSKDVETNTIVVAEGDESPALYKKELMLTNVNFLDPNIISLRCKVFVRIRYRQPLQEATLIFPHQSASSSASIRVLFAEPQKAIAPGQSAVFYSKKGELLGGGIIQ
ncbi:MAG: tRNA 2-thiouridine(34) synthase MnmA [Nanoarchaeota archaeon]|nr:tRNA 2-thiouridine(34) synthase MnmA [Nanoarchaeota archaeon]